jgi:hypothetical protein
MTVLSLCVAGVYKSLSEKGHFYPETCQARTPTPLCAPRTNAKRRKVLSGAFQIASNNGAGPDIIPIRRSSSACCHPERSEGSQQQQAEMLRCAQHDMRNVYIELV